MEALYVFVVTWFPTLPFFCPRGCSTKDHVINYRLIKQFIAATEQKHNGPPPPPLLPRLTRTSVSSVSAEIVMFPSLSVQSGGLWIKNVLHEVRIFLSVIPLGACSVAPTLAGWGGGLDSEHLTQDASGSKTKAQHQSMSDGFELT